MKLAIFWVLILNDFVSSEKFREGKNALAAGNAFACPAHMKTASGPQLDKPITAVAAQSNSNRSGEVAMNWKKFLIVDVGWGLGTAVGLAVILGGFLWYESRPKPPEPPKPWNRSAIKAEYDYVDTEGDKNNIVFYYTLENTTDFDFRLEDGKHVGMNAVLERQRSLSAFTESESVDYPISVPAKKRIRFPVHFGYPYPEKGKPNADLQERRKYRAGLENYISTEMGNLDDFDLLDETNRYEIVLPGGWKKAKQQP
jgi:hypothetical protein